MNDYTLYLDTNSGKKIVIYDQVIRILMDNYGDGRSVEDLDEESFLLYVNLYLTGNGLKRIA